MGFNAALKGLIKFELDATVGTLILLQSHSTCFGCPQQPSSEVLKTVSVASATGVPVPEAEDTVKHVERLCSKINQIAYC